MSRLFNKIEAQELRDARRRFGLTQRRLAEMVGVDRSATVTNWETGQTRIPGAVAVLVNILERCPEARQVMGVRLPQERMDFATRLPVFDRSVL